MTTDIIPSPKTPLSLPAAVKAKWTTALRSNLFQQGTGQLARRERPETSELQYCCIGVFHQAVRDMSGEQLVEWETTARKGVDLYGQFANHFQGEDNTALVEYIGNRFPNITEKQISCMKDSGVANLFWNLNDNYGMSFAEIADIIDQIPDSPETAL